MKRMLPILIAFILFAAVFVYSALINTTLNDFRLAGSQPNQSGTIESPDRCDNCHGGYAIQVEPAFNWRGSMMAQAARDPLYLAALAIANQDAAFAGDLCIRCHAPRGWLGGRSTPTDGSALTDRDRDGVQCDFCHKLVKPTPIGTNPYPSDAAYTSGTYARDQAYLGTLAAIPPRSANGMYIVDSDNAKRGPYTDPVARHSFYYSPFHRDAAICGTCHDVSNPVFDKNVDGSGNYYYTLNSLNTPPPSNDPYMQFPVERTFSEWLMSSYNTPQGVFAPQFGGNRQYVSTCQDCHMRDVTGKGCNKNDAPVRSDLPLHDMTGGNTWVPKIIPSFFPGEVNVAALDSSVRRATYMLKNAASILVDEFYPVIRVRVTNETGHKLPSGYPEGRRIWINVKAYDGTNALIAEFGAYDSATGVLQTSNTKVYEAKLGMSPEVLVATGLTNEPDGSSFHFVLNNVVVKDNRIPPRGFTNANFKQIQSPPVGYAYTDGQHWDTTSFALPPATDRYVVSLYYQTASKEYIEFLRDNNTTNTWGTQLYNAWVSSGKSPPVLMQRYVSETALPVQLASFTASVQQGNDVLLEWMTLSEINNYGFFVQRRVQGTGEFADRPGSFVPGHGTTLQPHYYSWTDVAVPPGTYEYRLRQVDLDGRQHLTDPIIVVVTSTTHAGGAEPLPKEFALLPNYPNPFNPSTTFGFALPKAVRVKLEVFTMSGRHLVTVLDRDMPAGYHSVAWSARDGTGRAISSGTYIYRILAGEFSATRKMVVVK